MTTDSGNATQNQKVFVTLRGYTEVVNEYHRVLAEIDRKRKEQGTGAQTSTLSTWIARRDALQFVFRTLELPCNLE